MECAKKEKLLFIRMQLPVGPLFKHPRPINVLPIVNYEKSPFHLELNFPQNFVYLFIKDSVELETLTTHKAAKSKTNINFRNYL